MRIKLLILIIFIPFSLCGQELITNENVVLKRGIYKNFEEFKYNKPSIKLNFKVVEEIEKFGKDNYEHISYLLIVDSLVNVGYVYGLCDGENIYVRENIGLEEYSFRSFKLKENTRFEVLGFVGLYSTFNTVGKGNGGLGIIHSTIKAIAVKKMYSFAIDITSGEVIGISKGNVKDALRADKILYKEYKDAIWEDTLTIESMKNYLVRYSNIHIIDGIVK